MNVAIDGSGIAAACCAHVLTRRGLPTRTMPRAGGGAPVVMLSATAVALIRDVFDRPDLLATAHRITRRIVAWGGAVPATMPHDAIVVSGTALAAALACDAVTDDAMTGDMTVRTRPRDVAPMMRFGTRVAWATMVRLCDRAAATDSWIEAIDAGWLFLIPSDAAGAAWLLSVGGPIDEALRCSRHIAPRIVTGDAPHEMFDPAPRLAPQLTGPDWIACGSAAIAFDPIAGDGTAQAVRAAILAAAVIGGIADGGDPDALRGHYDAMLTAAMRRHLQLCAPFYLSGGTGGWWQAAHAALARGHDACTARLAAAGPPRFVLDGHDLVPRALVA
ncbi:hypothetical protein [Sphingomonas adhaesiva]|uniref:hypothetical protein n=1 Tax=Sphingomonas adhaesiva TaxID=28212 RepID=UPI002FFCDDD1